MAAERFEIRIAGSGGQGVILATELIGQAITHYEPEFYVVQSQAYGPEARGGKSKAEVVISSEPIDYPKVIAPSLQIILTQAAADEFAVDTQPGGRIVYDDFFVTELPGTRLGDFGGGSVESSQVRIDARVYALPIVRTAREKLGREIVTNMVALGCVGRVLELEKIASPDSLRRVIAAHFPVQKIADLNIQAFDAGSVLSEIGRITQDLARLIGSITLETEDQSLLAERVNASMRDILSITEQTMQGTKSSAEAVGQLAAFAAGLKNAVARFKV